MKSVETEPKGEQKKTEEKEKDLFKFSWLEIFSFSSVFFLLFSLLLLSFNFGLSSIEQVKISTVVYTTFFSLLFFTSYFLKNGTLRLGKYKLLILTSAVFVPFVYLLSSFFSGDFQNSFSGRLFEIDTFTFLFLCFALLSITSILFKSRERIFLGFLSFALSCFILLILQFLGMFFGGNFLEGIDFARFNFVGSWNEFALVVGAVSILSLITLENINPGWILKIFLYLILIFSLFFLSVINFALAWIFIAIFCFGVLTYFVSRNNLQKKFKIFSEESASIGKSKKYFFIIPFIFFIISCAFLFKGNLISSKLANFVSISQTEARPSIESTIKVGENVYNEHFFLGSGPNTFKNKWAEFKPEGVNNSLFWNEDFEQGFSYITTSVISTGFLSILAWSLFFLVFLYTGIKVLLFYKIKEAFSYYLSLASFITAFYFWLSLAFYAVGPVSIVLAFIFTGLFAASVSQTKEDFVFDFSVSDKPRLGFVMIFLFGIIFILSVGGVFITTEKVSANISFERAAAFLENKNKLNSSESYVKDAISVDPQDIYLRLASEIKIIQIKKLLSGKKELKKEDYEEFRMLLASAIGRANSATREGKNYYRNWLKLGDIYSSVISLNISDSYEKAKEAYKEALLLSPNNPLIYLKIARAETANENLEDAKEYIRKALSLKNNYTEAIFLLSQIQIKEGNLDSAIKSVKSASLMNSNDPTLFFQLGILYYNKENYEKAAEALQKTLSLSKNYANARYFLGLSYYNLDKKEKALNQLAEVSKLNPDNKEIEIMIENMKAGRDPFSEISKEKEKKGNKLPVDL